MTDLFRIFATLQYSRSKKEKIKILIANENNSLFKETLKWLLSPFTVTGIDNKKLHKTVTNIGFLVNEWKDMMIYLNENHTGTNKDIATVQRFVSLQPSIERQWYEQLITRNLKLGVDAKTVNAVYGKGFIPCFDIQLANKYFEHTDKVKDDFTITEKLDGVRMVTLVDSYGNIRFYTRQGREIEKLIDIESDIESLNLKNVMLDGELVSVYCDEIDSKDNYRETVKTVRKDGIKQGLKYMVFDTMSFDAFTSQDCKLLYSERRKLLNMMPNKPHFEVLPVLYNGFDTEKITLWLSWARQSNREGVMINLNKGTYDFKRTNNLLKVKVMTDADLLITGVYEGAGRNKGKLGGVEVEFVYREKHYRCNCGSGFSDEERIKYWDNPEILIGKIATIQYFEITKNADGDYGLRFPVWISRIREDKTKISMN